MKIKPTRKTGPCRTGSLDSKLTIKEITAVLGFPPNCSDIDDPDKVKNSWGFTVESITNGIKIPLPRGTKVKIGKKTEVLCGIWDYKGCRWSTYGPTEILEQLFPGRCSR